MSKYSTPIGPFKATYETGDHYITLCKGSEEIDVIANLWDYETDTAEVLTRAQFLNYVRVWAKAGYLADYIREYRYL